MIVARKIRNTIPVICKKWIILILVCLLLVPETAHLEQKSVKIIVTYEENAMNIPAEEAFFSTHPDINIEYILYTEDQLYTHLLSGTTDADLVILPYHILKSMAEKGYLEYLDDIAGLKQYPAQLIDVKKWLMIENRLFALPVRISQNSWYWNDGVGKKLGISYPGNKAWSWTDYEKLSQKFPIDIDHNGHNDTYVMYGSSISAFPALNNVNTDMLEQYIANHSEFDTFKHEYLNLFKLIVTSSALLNINSADYKENQVLLGISGNNPVYTLDHMFAEENGDLLFLPPPTLDGTDGPYPGYLNACGILQNAKSKDLATDFIHAMISDEALNYIVMDHYDELISRKSPEWEFISPYSEYMPVFTQTNDFPVLNISPGRELKVVEFTISEEAFQTAQHFRSKLQVNTIPYRRDFFEEWLYGNINDDGLTSRMNYLLEIAGSQK